MYDIPTLTCPVNYWLAPIATKKIITAADVIRAACVVFKIDGAAIFSKRRYRNLVKVRNVCMYIMRERLNMTLVSIAALFNRDHTTAIHAINTIKNDLSVPAYRQKTIEEIRAVVELL